MACFLQMFCIKFYLLKKLIIFFLQIKAAYQNSISNYGIISRAAKKTVVVIYKVMYTEHCENTLRTKAIDCINNESLDPF